MSAQLPSHTRPRTYAGNELLLDLLWSVRSRLSDLDLEMLLILLIVNEATMRPFLAVAKPRLDWMRAIDLPDGARGAISRVSIADKAFLPRETVRRKVNQLIETGVLRERKDGEIQSVFKLDDPSFQAIGDECHQAVERYHERLRLLCDLGAPTEEGDK